MRAAVAAVLLVSSTAFAGEKTSGAALNLQAPPPQAPGAGAAPPAAGQPAAGQQPAAPPPAPSTPARAPGDPYTYSSEGRRDPFVSLLGSGEGPRASSKRTDGPATMAVADISVRGIMQSRGALVAMVQGPDNKTYIVRQGEKFLDGTLKTITSEAIVILQDVDDPLSLVKHREVRKVLRSLEDAK